MMEHVYYHLILILKINMTSIGDYNKIMSDRNIFNQIVYTLLSEALRFLGERQKNYGKN